MKRQLYFCLFIALVALGCNRNRLFYSGTTEFKTNTTIRANKICFDTASKINIPENVSLILICKKLSIKGGSNLTVTGKGTLTIEYQYLNGFLNCKKNGIINSMESPQNKLIVVKKNFHD